jgi:hypothetical protein
LREAAGIFRDAGRSVHVAEAAADVLGATAEVWRTSDAPQEHAGARDLVRFLAGALPNHMRSHAAG